MNKKDILELFKRFGLSEYESKAYFALNFLGPSRAGDISRESSVPQSKIYETLEQLADKQLIEVFEGRPKEFKAVKPNIALNTLIERREVELKSLKVNIPAVSSLLKSTKDEIIKGVWTQKSKKRDEVLTRLSEMLDRCKKYAYGITKDFSFSTKYKDSIKNCVRRGVKFKLVAIGPINESNCPKVKWYNANNIPVRVFETKIHPRILVVDGKEVSVRLDQGQENDFTFNSIWSQDPSLVKVFDTYIKNLWKISQPAH